MTSKQIERRFEIFKTFVAVSLALGLALVVISFVSESPVDAITAFIVGPFQRATRISNIIEVMTPLLFTGTAICMMYQANQFSMIGEGAFLIGANLATWFAITHDKWQTCPFIVCNSKPCSKVSTDKESTFTNHGELVSLVHNTDSCTCKQEWCHNFNNITDTSSSLERTCYESHNSFCR